MDYPILPNAWAQVKAMFRRHPHELYDALFSVIAGVVFILSTFLPAFDPSPSFMWLPDYMGVVMGAPTLVGGCMVIKAMLCQWENLAARWRVERAGLSLMGMTWLAFSFLVIWYRWQSIVPAGFALFMSIKCWTRGASSRAEERRFRHHREH